MDPLHAVRIIYDEEWNNLVVIHLPSGLNNNAILPS